MNNRQLTFLLRRVEHEIDPEQSISEIINVFKEDQCTTEDIFRTIEKDIMYKVKVLNAVGIGFFLNEEYESVIPFLELALRCSPTDPDTIYNIGYVLMKFGLNDEALRFLNQVNCYDEGVVELKRQIEGSK